MSAWFIKMFDMFVVVVLQAPIATWLSLDPTLARSPLLSSTHSSMTGRCSIVRYLVKQAAGELFLVSTWLPTPKVAPFSLVSFLCLDSFLEIYSRYGSLSLVMLSFSRLMHILSHCFFIF